MPIDKDATLVFLPCLMGNDLLWRAQARFLSPKISYRFADFSTQTSIAEMARQVLQENPGPLVLAGLSLGGYVAFEIWRQAPQRVQAMILANTSARSEAPEQTRSRQALMERVRGGWTMDQLCRAIMPFLVHRKQANDQQLTESITKMARALGPDVFFRQQQAIMQRANSLPDLPHIQIPVLVVGGDFDTVTPPECQQEMVEGLAQSQLVMLACGHMSAMEQPESLNQHIGAFLDSN